MKNTKIIQGDCLDWLKRTTSTVDLTFLDPPFNQGREYRHFDDSQNPAIYWAWMSEILANIRGMTSPGGSIYFMQREKNTQYVLNALEKTGWVFQNLIIWKKKGFCCALL